MNEELGNYIKNRREKLGISQRELARRIKIDNATISKIENGSVKRPSIEVLFKIANELNVSVFKLFHLSNYDVMEKIMYTSSIDEIYEQELLRQIDNSVIDRVISVRDDIPFLDINKILNEYKNDNINKIEVMKLITACRPIDINDQLIYMSDDGDIVLKLNDF